MDMFAPETLLGAFRYLHALVKRGRVAVTGRCLLCGRCCRRLSLQVDGGFIASRQQFDQACAKDERYRRFTIIGADAFGTLLFTCGLLDGDRCSDYANRFDFCKNYPTVNLYFLGQNLLPGCGFSFSFLR
jgi:hypothetical protein